MAKYGKWLGGGLGWAFGGPIGAVIGFALGSFYDNNTADKETRQYDSGYRRTGSTGDAFGGNPYRSQRQTRVGDFEVSLLILSAAVMKADGKVMKSELNYVKEFLKGQVGEAKAKQALPMLKEILEKDVSVRQICLQIRANMPHPMRLQLMHYLFGIANADKFVDSQEFQVLHTIANYLGISPKDFSSMSAMFKAKDIKSAYEILEINKGATDSEVKKAYRKMAVKYHPDKVSQLGESHQKAAKEKFLKVQEAYEQIKKERGFA
jgi:DnaJ like chaperone protein